MDVQAVQLYARTFKLSHGCLPGRRPEAAFREDGSYQDGTAEEALPSVPVSAEEEDNVELQEESYAKRLPFHKVRMVPQFRSTEPTKTAEDTRKQKPATKATTKTAQEHDEEEVRQKKQKTISRPRKRKPATKEPTQIADEHGIKELPQKKQKTISQDPRRRVKKPDQPMKEERWCYCGQPDDGRGMIDCDACGDWFHWECTDLKDMQFVPGAEVSWLCRNCARRQPGERRCARETTPVGNVRG